MILVGFAVEVKGFGSLLVSATKWSMAPLRSATDRKTPRLSRRRASLAKKPSTALSHDAEVGVKWKVQRRCRASHRRTAQVNPGNVGSAFKDYVNRGPPTILSHVEYAIIEEIGGTIDVRLRRVLLDKDKLRDANRQSNHPLRDFLLRQYS
jgi:hypothetical protein